MGSYEVPGEEWRAAVDSFLGGWLTGWEEGDQSLVIRGLAILSSSVKQGSMEECGPRG